MKFILLSALFVTTASVAEPEMPGVTGNKFVSELKALDVEKQIMNSTEVRECMKQHKYDSSITNEDDRRKRLAAAEICFQNKLPKDKKSLEEFSANMGLQQYGLVQSNNVQEITKFLSNKLYKAMTGVDRDKKNLDEMMRAESFKNRKMVDQKDFLDLYKTQLTKNALFEISRFCFEDLRLVGASTATNFADYWDSYLTSPPANPIFKDDGEPAFDQTATSKDKQDIYQKYAANLGNLSKHSAQLSKFFMDCRDQIGKLCKTYEESSPTARAGTGKACLAKERLRNLRKAMSDADLLAEDFEKNLSGGKFVKLDNDERLNVYNKENPDTSVDALTNYSSADFLAGEGNSLEQKADECISNPERSECEKFLNKNDSEETLYNVSLNQRLKDQAEIARIKKMKDDNDSGLEEYLQKNGFHELAKELKNGMTDDDLKKRLEMIFGAKRDALISSMRAKLDRQKKDPKAATPITDDEKKKAEVVTAATLNKDERQRLGQVVLFNNIISSHLELQKKTDSGYETVGRNTKAMEVELEGQKTAQIDDSLFSGLKTKDKDGGKEMNFTEIGAAEIIDPILGKD